MKSIELNQEQAQVLINLLNLANLSKGLEVAESCLFFTKKIQEAFKVYESMTKDEAVEVLEAVTDLIKK